MKGFADYVITLDDEISRELERDIFNIEVPYMTEEYQKWMVAYDRKTENVAKSYISYIKALDKAVFLYEEDFFALLPEKIKEGDFDAVSSLFDKYLEFIEEEFVSSKEEDYGCSPKNVSNWRSAFKNYRRFVEGWLLSENSSGINERLFAEDVFFEWLTTVDKKEPASAQSYVSRLKRLSRTIKKISAKDPNVQDVFDLIPQYLKEQKGEEITKLLTKLDEKLTSKIKENDTSLMPIDALRNCVSALHKYHQFLVEEHIGDISREIKRTNLNIKVPYMSGEYQKWMVAHDRKTENVARSYISYIRTLDKAVFPAEEDFFELLPKEIKEGDFDAVSSLFDKYLGIIEEKFVSSKEEDNGHTSKKVSDYRSAFKNYRRFVEGWLLFENSSGSNERLFAEDVFSEWLTTVEQIGPASAQSYVSRLKRLNRAIKQISAKGTNVQDVFDLIPQYLKEQKGEEISNLLTNLDEKLTSKIKENDISLMPIDALRNCVSALRKYHQFLVEEHIRDISREIKRVNLNIEVPYMSGEYQKWMVANDGKTENVARFYVSYIRTLDKAFFPTEEDFFELLPKGIKAGDFEAVSSLFDKYLEIIEEKFVSSKEEGNGYTSKKVSDCRSAFKNYRRFVEGWLLPENSSSINEAKDYKRLFAEDVFSEWLTTVEQIGPASAQSYVSRLKRLNRAIKQTSAKDPKDQDVFDLIPQYLKEQKGEEISNLLTNLDVRLTSSIKENDISLMPIDALRNCVSALRKYHQFLIEEHIGDISNNDEAQIEDNIEVSPKGVVKIYDLPTLKNNFHFRLTTQNRMSNSKDVFFPITIIKRLFQLSEKVSVDSTVCKGEYRWFNKWIDNCIAEIKIATDKGNFTMSKLSETNAIMIDTATKVVRVTLEDGKIARMLTPSADEQSPFLFMTVNDLKNIHIDHTPQISNILSENIEELTAMRRLTEIIRDVAEANNLAITNSNFSSINKKVISSKKYGLEMLKMIPILKNDLELIREKSALQLMENKYNLIKK